MKKHIFYWHPFLNYLKPIQLQKAIGEASLVDFHCFSKLSLDEWASFTRRDACHNPRCLQKIASLCWSSKWCHGWNCPSQRPSSRWIYICTKGDHSSHIALFSHRKPLPLPWSPSKYTPCSWKLWWCKYCSWAKIIASNPRCANMMISMTISYTFQGLNCLLEFSQVHVMLNPLLKRLWHLELRCRRGNMKMTMRYMRTQRYLFLIPFSYLKASKRRYCIANICI